MHGLNVSMWLLPEVRRRRSAAEVGGGVSDVLVHGPWSVMMPPPKLSL
jgi:hypothetical protein